MDASVKPETASPKEAAQTLGGLLYRDNSTPRTSEQQWVDLVRAISGGDTSAFGTIYMWTHGIVFTSILRITGNRSIAEDVTLEVYHDIWRGASGFDPASGTVIAWIMNLARARALENPRADGAVVQAEMRAAVQTLSTGERQAIEDAYFSQQPSARLAEREVLPSTVIRSRIRSGLGRLGAFLTLKLGSR
jgi:RNA polymerase sigma-70 factor (ECF subfamily)